jgi:hypothetical protein
MRLRITGSYLLVATIAFVASQRVWAEKPVSKCLEPGAITHRCISIDGNLHVWNGWPPNLRITATDGRVFGLGYDDSDDLSALPAVIRKLVSTNGQQVDGRFKICLLERVSRVPDEERELQWACFPNDRGK